MRPRRHRSQQIGSIEHVRLSSGGDLRPSPGGDLRPSPDGDEGSTDRTRVKRKAEEPLPLAAPPLRRARAECSALLESWSSQEAPSTAPNSSPAAGSPLLPARVLGEVGGWSEELEEGLAGRLETATEGLQQGFELEVVAGGVRRRAEEGEEDREAPVALEGGGWSSVETTQCSPSTESAEEEVAGPSAPGEVEVPSIPMVDRFPDLEALEEEEWHTPADTPDTSEPDLLVYRWAPTLCRTLSFEDE